LTYWVYLLARKRDGTLYLGVTNNLGRRIWEHRNKIHAGFSARYGVDRLVWYEGYDRIDEAIAREKAIKKWRRAWKIALIEALNPEWVDLYESLNN
jgi:putative endonuclease